ncbi:hypothetical protein C5748_27130 [Phyllobacterium phragmitis]|uniref:Uncharacterized protein n=1 Tax=Phyllobacterium phragmitis TaxID=2670329 RepID=A0A2S9IIS4_9HYPH|nr:hypothetical protein [Phyllobacterium phragmitis]PRD40417.1 hypothetical protein C5748_27130 [Phyllobacterium phragmitis]
MPIPLLFIPFVAYNLMALGLTRGGMGWDTPLVSLPLPSSETFRFTLGDGLVLIALTLLLISLRLRPARKSAFARAAMLAVPLAYAGEFLLIPAAATSLFFTCLAMSVAESLMEWRGDRSER